MKKIFKFLPLLLVAVMGFSLTACGDDDKDNDEPISANQLPVLAKDFISTYYPAATITSTVKDNDEYEVKLSEGTRIDFNLAGEWTDVDAAMGKTIPSGFYPSAIDTYISDNLDSVGINEISKEGKGYDVELVDGRDLLFGYDGSFISYDID